MTPTLAGRLQTRLALAVVTGLPVALATAGLLDRLTIPGALMGLLAVTVLGLGWDAAYTSFQDRRWDRDWPRLFTLLSWAPEAFGSWLALNLLGAAAPLGAHLVLVTALWVAALVAQGTVLPVLLPHWRHDGRRLAGVRTRAVPVDAPAHAAAPASHGSRLGIGALAQRPGLPRLATLALFAAVIAAVVFLAPLLGKEKGTSSADARLTHGEEHQAAQVEQPTRRRDWDTTKRVLPSAVAFPDAGLSTKLGMTLMKEDGVLVTPDPDHAAWYGQGAAPGQRGPAVVIGSTDSVFTGLDKARRGQQIRIVRADGSRVAFVVDRVATVDARSFPTQEVYGADRRPLLRLVGYDEESGRNTIVFAHAAWVIDPVEG